MRLNRSELTVGACFGLFFLPWIGLWAIPLACCTSYLWALSGAGYPKLLRRLGVPFLACLALYLVRHDWHVWLSLPLAFGILSLGYGVPSTQPPDKGSMLGRFWSGISPQWADILTRGSIYLMLACSYLVFL